MSKSYKDILNPSSEFEYMKIPKDTLLKPIIDSTIFNFNAEVMFKTKKHNGHIMCKDVIVANVVEDEISIVNGQLCPFYLLTGGDFLGWLSTRSIDIHRTHSRLLRKVLRLTEVDNRYSDDNIALASHAASITDCYWFKSLESNLNYKDVSKFSDILSDVALLGDLSIIDEYKNEVSPEFTNVGSFEKCWKYISDSWYLIKKATLEEKFSEYLTYKLGEHLGFKMAEYSINENLPNVILSKDFTNNGSYNFEPMFSLVRDNEDYDVNLKQLHELGQAYKADLVTDYINILFLDSLVNNVDRHTHNYGIIRKFDKGNLTNHVIGMAPNFDNNISLVSRPYKGISNRAPIAFLGMLVDLSEIYDKYKIPDLEYEDLNSIVKDCAKECNYDLNSFPVTDYIYNNYTFLLEHCIYWDIKD